MNISSRQITWQLNTQYWISFQVFILINSNIQIYTLQNPVFQKYSKSPKR